MLGTVYRPPDTSVTFWDQYNYHVESISPTNDKLLILGDFNIDVLKVRAPQHNHMQQHCREHCLKNIVSQPTRSPSNSCLDLVLCSEDISGAKCNVIPQPGLTDHHLLVVSVDLPLALQTRVTLQLRKPSLRKMNVDSCVRTLDSAFRQSCFGDTPSDLDSRSTPGPDVADMAASFTSVAMTALDQHAPVKTVTLPSIRKPRPQPWVNIKLKKLLEKGNVSMRRSGGVPTILLYYNSTAAFEGKAPY